MAGTADAEGPVRRQRDRWVTCVSHACLIMGENGSVVRDVPSKRCRATPNTPCNPIRRLLCEAEAHMQPITIFWETTDRNYATFYRVLAIGSHETEPPKNTTQWEQNSPKPAKTLPGANVRSPAPNLPPRLTASGKFTSVFFSRTSGIESGPPDAVVTAAA